LQLLRELRDAPFELLFARMGVGRCRLGASSRSSAQ